MAQMINSIYAKLLEKRIKLARTKTEFYSNYLPLRKAVIKEKLNRKIDLLELKYRAKLLPYEINAGIESDYLLENYQDDVSRIEDKYYWKARVVKASAKRKGLDSSKKLEELNQAKLDALKVLKNKYYPQVNPDSLEEYENTKALLSEELLEAKQKLITQSEERISKITNYTEERVNKYQNLAKELNEKLLVIAKSLKAKYELPEDIILSLENLSMHFGGLKAVDDLSFSVKEGEIFGLIGPNGAGKTTVFNCITRFYKPTAGEIYFKNINNEVVLLNDKKVHNIIREGIVRTFQNVEIVWELNVLDNLLVAAHTVYRSGFFGHLLNSRLLRQEEKVMKNKALKILEDLGLSAYQFAYPLGLPYGILKKIELARTLMANPKLIILDEPAAGLNDAETDDLAKVIKKISQDYKATIFLVEHDMGLVMEICDTVCAISFGKKLAIGTPKEIQSSKVVQEAYLGGE